jgi:hypothetical protein
LAKKVAPSSDLLTSEAGELEELNSRTMILGQDETNKVPSKIGAMKHINDKIIPYRKFFPSILADHSNFEIGVQQSSLFEGFCPYGFDQAFYLSPDNRRILKGTFKGELLVKQ